MFKATSQNSKNQQSKPP